MSVVEMVPFIRAPRWKGKGKAVLREEVSASQPCAIVISDTSPDTTDPNDEEKPQLKGEQKAVASIPIVLDSDFDDEFRWKGKSKAIIPDVEDQMSTSMIQFTAGDVLEVDWTKYEPPQGLRNTIEIKSEIIRQIIQNSIDQVKSRIAEEEAKRIAEAEAEKSQEEERARLAAEDRKASEAPEAVLDGDSDTVGDSSRPAMMEKMSHPITFAGVQLHLDAHGLLRPADPAKSKKRSLMGLLRRLNNNEKAEGSMSGATRHKHSLYTSSVDLTSPTGKRRFALDVKKVTSNNSSSPTSSIHEEIIECVSCLDDFTAKEMVKAPCHSYCHDCFARLITAACENEQQWPPKCCLNDIPEGIVLSNTSTELRARYRERAEEWNIPVSDRIYCHQPDCSLWIQPIRIDQVSSLGTCANGHRTCTICHGPQHDEADCPQDRDLIRTEELAEEEGWRRCHLCHAFIEHREACQHMTCRCGAEFCYVCGAIWRSCACTMDQLRAVKNSAATRRQERQAREAREEAEIAEALRLVEEFEREQARKAELLRLELERVERERKERELQEKLEKEEQRRVAVEAKFQELRELLKDLHERQWTIVKSEHDKEEANTRSRALLAMGKLRAQHKAERETIEVEANTKITDRKRELDCEYAIRVAEERRIEEEYHKRLCAFWGDRKGGERGVEDALRKLKRRMDNAHAVWWKWMQNEMEACQYQVQEEQDIRFELMHEAERRLALSSEWKWEELLRRNEAEVKWVDAVVREREGMLNDMENGEDIEAWFAEGGLNGAIEEELKVPGAYRWD
ncbi:uncharacterized protein BCR38DRAFT_408212 [Pseudomassariella vexata]|uniref:RBR-type E3 ubiquitin transferase n=1 Tax=Pseudomassariella vexata TaxID=1141098 RepID=A0A1Y2E4H8_9PEZI|nr:uncharacterized protein BCR38DRAFT_408212 [Pseudomassariella vexata]ORY66254.1 hypothetical protein BCR38DRAFT_408212 [Pseudomassariella vexata]